jgi:hypothetical protein
MPTTADPLYQEGDPQAAIKNTRGGMMMIIPASLWEVLTSQGHFEGRRPGEVLDSAVRDYMRDKGSPEVVEFLRLVEDAEDSAEEF